MWVFLCVVALCTLLTPSQGSESALAELTLCKEGFLSTFTDILTDDKFMSCLPLNPLLNLGGSGGLGGLLNTLTSTVGLKINSAKVAAIDLNLAGDNVILEVRSMIDITLDSPVDKLLGNLPVLPVPLGLSSGPTRIIVELCFTLPLTLSVNEKNELVLVLVEDDCKVPELKIRLYSGMLKEGPLSALSGVTDSLTEILCGPLTKCLSSSVCKLLATVVKQVNGLLSKVTGTLPIGNSGSNLKCLVTAVKRAVGDCVRAEINVALNGKLIAVKSASGSPKLPKCKHDCLVMHQEVLQACLDAQVSAEFVNQEIALWEDIVWSEETVTECITGAEMHGGVTLEITIISGPKIIFKKDEKPAIKMIMEVEGTGIMTEEKLFVAKVEVELKAEMHLEGQKMMSTLELKSVTIIEITTTYTVDEQALEEAFMECGENILIIFQSVNLMYPAPNMLPYSETGTIQIREQAVVVSPGQAMKQYR